MLARKGRVEESHELAVLDETDVADFDFASVRVRSGVPERVAITKREKLLCVDIPSSRHT